MRPKTPRYHWLDALRGIALVAMAIYHFCWNLELFGYLDAGSAGSGGLKMFARCIASSFLILVGISLTLAHAQAIRWSAFWNRWLKVAAAAFVISIATYFATPSAFIYFGILHHIALASLLGLAFLRMSTIVIIMAVMLVLAAGFLVNVSVFDTRLLAWTGLYELPPRSNDFVPLVPWFAAVLFGMVIGRQILLHNDKIDDISPSGKAKPLTVIGRHSLLFYLLHQPVLIAIVYIASLVMTPAIQNADVESTVFFECVQTCGETNADNFCAQYCGCAVDAMKTRNILLSSDENQSRIDIEMADIANQCAATAMESQSQ